MMSDFSGSFLTPSPTPNVRFLPSNVQFLESFLVIFDSPLKSDRHHLCTFPKEDIDVIVVFWDVKGQIISECLFDVFQFSKKPPKNLTNFCPRI